MIPWEQSVDTPRDPVIRDVCPGCQPEADWRYALIAWCALHRPTDAGSEALGDWYAHGTTEVDGDSNKALCDFLHRGTA